MESNLKVLYISSAISPFIKTYKFGEMLESISKKLLELNVDVRGIVPKFGIISDRRNKLHEVIRLSDVNIIINNEEYPLSVKVASLRHSTFQVYFMDNKEYFNRKGIFNNKDEKFYTDNDERMLFFCIGAIKSIIQLEWIPDIIHCNDWFSALIPLCIKTIYKDDPTFAKTKIIFTIHANSFTYKFDKSIIDKVATITGLDKAELESINPTNFEGIISAAVRYSDLTTTSIKPFNNHNAINDIIEKENIEYIPNNDEGMEEKYINIYKSLLGK